ncbi:hypothetical protein L873DRAFT_1825609 [Choiromyces venosus 120613-1]|uniref:Uncharacterized protein n=1 Tax=Choiromyces venosus 120613-1 TaxID=1336337 RepID=A0A3N4K1E6_9PEZI|nr:hypothetical protein L873DRAFT_1825609 [Choiromyces venosus 120613-1]
MMEYFYPKFGVSFKPKDPIKLFLPTHDMFWKIPYERKPYLAGEIDEILKGIKESHAAVKKRNVYTASISSYGIGMPFPGRWVLVDLKDGSFVHKNYMGSLVYPGAEYVVLCMGSTEIPKEILRPFRNKVGGQGEDEDEDDAVFVDANDEEDIENVA